ncbi:hypothetical protein [Streptomyces mirabilis]|uniref:hypothetical protein n=1 Tax=Streptomyces mirabilis TaxID=68239 RepID=UPI00167E8DB2|nr:hypothetical protein [Streptomyces mirabilis]
MISASLAQRAALASSALATKAFHQIAHRFPYFDTPPLAGDYADDPVVDLDGLT